jgi:hypothetical protein
MLLHDPHPARLPPLKKDVEQGIRAACRSPVKRLPDAVGNAFCKNGGRISRSWYAGPADSLPHINVGDSEAPTKREFAEAIADAVRFAGADESDRSEAKAPLRKLIDRSRLRALSWMPQKNLRQGLRTIAALVESIELNGQ